MQIYFCQFGKYIYYCVNTVGVKGRFNFHSSRGFTSGFRFTTEGDFTSALKSQRKELIRESL